MTTVIFRKETIEDFSQIDALIKMEFSNSHNKRAVSILRKNVSWKMNYCFVAEKDAEIIGSIRFFTVRLPSGRSVVMLGPLGVKKIYRGQGIGQTLVENALHALAGYEDGVLVVGIPDYYDIYGFETEVVQGLKLEGEIKPLELMGLEFENDIFADEKGFVRA